MMLFLTLACLMIGLSGWIIVEDIRHLEIPAIPVLALSGLMILTGALFPLPGLILHHALLGALIGLTMGTVTRAYIHLRTGVAAFGGADIALICGAGGLLGPFLFGPWLFIAALLGAVLMISLSAFSRTENVDGSDLDISPLCPALIASICATYILAYGGIIPANITF